MAKVSPYIYQTVYKTDFHRTAKTGTYMTVYIANLVILDALDGHISGVQVLSSLLQFRKTKLAMGVARFFSRQL